MTLGAIFNIAGSALTAETARLTSSAQNMSIANVESGSSDDVYKPKYPIFKAMLASANQWGEGQTQGGVQVKGTYESTSDPIKRYAPDNPMADKQGFVYTPNINHVEEMANIISASRSYQMNVELLNATKQLMQRTLELGK